MNADNLFEQLDPPPGGAERFARRLDEAASSAAETRRWRGFALAGAACAAVALVVALVLLRGPSETPSQIVVDTQPTPEIYESPAFDRLLGRTLQAEPLTDVVNEQPIPVTELESQNANVRIYSIN
jgi:anti-sigma-K factor RskA